MRHAARERRVEGRAEQSEGRASKKDATRERRVEGRAEQSEGRASKKNARAQAPVFAGVAGTLLLAAAARAQLVPLERCHAAYPCNLPYGLRPADAVANLPDARLGNTLIGFGVDDQFRLRVVAPPVSPDFSAAAARLYVKQHPLSPAASPTPPAKTGAAPAPAKTEPSP